MHDMADRDYFTDPEILADPYSYFEAIRAGGPVAKLRTREVVMVTGYREAIDVHLNTNDFTPVITGGGPLLPLPFEVKGDDITEQIEAHHDKFVGSDLLVCFDGERHTAARALINPLFTPARLKDNEKYMKGLADRMIADVVAKGGCDIIQEIAYPFATLVIADLLGVPEEDREKFRQVIEAQPPPGNLTTADKPPANASLKSMAGFFITYIEDRRANPRDDVMTLLATMKYPNGSAPSVLEVANTARLLFAAGHDTTAKLLGNSVLFLAEDQRLHQALRTDSNLVADFLEEMLRLDGSIKVTKRLCKRTTRVGGMEIPAGRAVVIALAAANRDPQRWESPQEFRLGRPKIREHLAFGRGTKTCPGAALARAEVRTVLQTLLEKTSSFSLSQSHHGPAGARTVAYEPSYLMRGLRSLHIVVTPR
jgi:cytochrome P450